MIIGVGTDIVEIERISKAILRGSFLEKSFTCGERAYFACKGNHSETLAGIFAAKEAVAKSMGTGFRGFSLIDVEIVHSELGEPKVILSEKATFVARERGITLFNVSIAHNQSMATAYAISSC